MGISSSMNAGVMGLAVNASRLSAISDNIANSATSGYKRSVVDFYSVVTGQSAGSYDAGGVRAGVQRDVEGRGGLLATGNATDIAISGNGLLPVTTVVNRDQPPSVRPTLLVSTGSFRTDENGYLVTSSGMQLLGWPTDSKGEVGSVIRASGASLEPVRIAGVDFASNPTKNIELGLNLPVEATSSTGSGDPLSTGIEYFDALGQAQNLEFKFTPTMPATDADPATNTWTLEISDETAGGVIGTYTVEFNNVGDNAGYLKSITTVSGAAYDAATGKVTVSVGHGDIDVSLGKPNEVSQLTQFASGFAQVGVTKDGTPVGGLNRVEINERGELEAIYNTGFRQTLYLIPVADVPNPNGLTALDNQAFAISPASGAVYFWNAGEGPSGVIAGYSLEQSATDIAEELTHLIETQRAYSSNAKIVQTVDEMLQETTNLKR